MRIKCENCKIKKTDYLLTKCKCNNSYCNDCKIPEIHTCTFDYLLYHQIILKKNKVILINKIKKI